MKVQFDLSIDVVNDHHVIFGVSSTQGDTVTWHFRRAVTFARPVMEGLTPNDFAESMVTAIEARLDPNAQRDE